MDEFSKYRQDYLEELPEGSHINYWRDLPDGTYYVSSSYIHSEPCDHCTFGKKILRAGTNSEHGQSFWIEVGEDEDE